MKVTDTIAYEKNGLKVIFHPELNSFTVNIKNQPYAAYFSAEEMERQLLIVGRFIKHE